MGTETIAVSQQHTQALKEDMLLDAAGLKINDEDLYLMLSQVKTISYNKVTVHSYIFLYLDSGEEISAHGRPVQTSSVPAA